MQVSSASSAAVHLCDHVPQALTSLLPNAADCPTKSFVWVSSALSAAVRPRVRVPRALTPRCPDAAHPHAVTPEHDMEGKGGWEERHAALLDDSRRCWRPRTGPATLPRLPASSSRCRRRSDAGCVARRPCGRGARLSPTPKTIATRSTSSRPRSATCHGLAPRRRAGILTRRAPAEV